MFEIWKFSSALVAFVSFVRLGWRANIKKRKYNQNDEMRYWTKSIEYTNWIHFKKIETYLEISIRNRFRSGVLANACDKTILLWKQSVLNQFHSLLLSLSLFLFPLFLTSIKAIYDTCSFLFIDYFIKKKFEITKVSSSWLFYLAGTFCFSSCSVKTIVFQSDKVDR